MNQTYNPLRLLEIAKSLGDLYLYRSKMTINQWQLEQDIEARKLFLTPPDGWPGKNEEQRRTTAQQAFSVDEQLIRQGNDLDQIRREISLTEADIAALETERRAIEWTIRGQLVEALQGARVECQSPGPVEERAFDDTADHQLDQAADVALVATDPLGDGIPF